MKRQFQKFAEHSEKLNQLEWQLRAWQITGYGQYDDSSGLVTSYSYFRNNIPKLLLVHNRNTRQVLGFIKSWIPGSAHFKCRIALARLYDKESMCFKHVQRQFLRSICQTQKNVVLRGATLNNQKVFSQTRDSAKHNEASSRNESLKRNVRKSRKLHFGIQALK